MRYLSTALLLGFLLEISGMIIVGRWIGVLPVLALLLASGIFGVSIIRRAGVTVGDALRRPGQQGEFATETAAASFLRLIAGLLLIVPGFLTDIVAILLLVPPLRRWVAGWFAQSVQVKTSGWQAPPRRNAPIIEGEAIEIEGEISGPSDAPPR